MSVQRSSVSHNDQNQMRTEHTCCSTLPGCFPTLTTGGFCSMLAWNISKTVITNLKIMIDPHASVGTYGFIISITRQATDKPKTRSMPGPQLKQEDTAHIWCLQKEEYGMGMVCREHHTHSWSAVNSLAPKSAWAPNHLAWLVFSRPLQEYCKIREGRGLGFRKQTLEFEASVAI